MIQHNWIKQGVQGRDREETARGQELDFPTSAQVWSQVLSPRALESVVISGHQPLKPDRHYRQLVPAGESKYRRPYLEGQRHEITLSAPSGAHGFATTMGERLCRACTGLQSQSTSPIRVPDHFAGPNRVCTKDIIVLSGSLMDTERRCLSSSVEARRRSER